MRYTRASFAGVAVAALALLTAPTAAADPATDFLTALRSSGFDPGTTPYDEEMALIHASAACEMLHYDYSPTQAREYLQFQYPNFSASQLGVFVATAQRTLCGPQYVPVKPDW